MSHSKIEMAHILLYLTAGEVASELRHIITHKSFECTNKALAEKIDRLTSQISELETLKTKLNGNINQLAQQP